MHPILMNLSNVCFVLFLFLSLDILLIKHICLISKYALTETILKD